MAFAYESTSVLCTSLAVLLSACVVAPSEDEPGESDASTGHEHPEATGSSGHTDANESTADGADETGTPPVDPPDPAATTLLGRLPGLWVAPVTSMTSVGNFPIMAMDMRPANDRLIFSRVDLDADNNLRFAFTTELVDGVPTLVFRNGGEFLGFLRDTRSALVDYDEADSTWTFCAIAGGCGYVEARVHFEDDATLVVSADVLGRPHMHWEGMRMEERALDGDFPYDDAAGDLTDPFPPMPTLNATVSWSEPVEEATETWLVLTTSTCTLVPDSCSPSRFMRATAPAGSTSVTLALEQIHAGEYQATAVLDRNGNMAATLFPDSGDRVSLPNQSVTVADRGESDVVIPLLVDL